MGKERKKAIQRSNREKGGEREFNSGTAGARIVSTDDNKGQCEWLEEWLFKELNPDSTLILDNSPIHRRWVIERMVAEAGHRVIFLPKYSPDFNKIEHDFAALKKRRANAPIDTPLDVIISDYAGRSAL